MPKRSYERPFDNIWGPISKNGFSARFSGQRKNGCFSVISFFLGPPPLVPIVFFGAPDITIKFSPSWTKIKGTSGSRKRALPSGQTGIFRKTKGIQSCLKIWGSPLKAWSACTAQSKRGDLFLFIGEPVCTWGGISDTHDIVQTSVVASADSVQLIYKSQPGLI